MGHERLQSTKGLLTALALLCLAFASPASAASSHPRTPSLDVTGLNHACGDAVDSKGDLYLASAGESKIKVYDPSHVLLTEIVDTSTPCGLAVTTTGNLYVSEQATGEVVRFKPSEYPPTVSTTYGSREVIDSSGKAKGIAVDPIDDRLYVAEDTKVALYSAAGSFEANLGEGTLTEATGVASYTTPAINFVSDHYLWVADAKGAEADRLYLFGGTEVGALKLRRQLNGSTTPDGSFGFGTNGAYLAEDPGNRNSEGKCVPVGEQACTAGHLYLYDAAHGALDEFDASGEYLDQTKDAAFADAKPTAVAIDRSGGANDGTLYVTTGVKALAFGPLKPPSRATLGEPLSHILKGAQAVATDSHGDVYAGAGAAVHIYGPSGAELTSFEDKHQPDDVAIDSTGKVYVLDVGAGFASEAEVTYYTPSAYPPKAGTTYTRHEPLIATYKDFSNIKPNAIATVPAPAPGKDRLLVTTSKTTHLYDSAANGSGLLDSDFAKGLTYTGATSNRQSIAVNGATGTVYFGNNTGSPGTIFGVNEAGTELLAKFQNTSSSNGEVGANPFVAVDQASGHVLEYDNTTQAREYDASGAFVAEFGNFTDSAARGYRIAVDSACALHEPKPLTGKACEEFDPANGTVYVAYDDPNKNHPPYDLNAFGPLSYPTAPVEPKEFKLTVARSGSGTGTVISSPAGIECGEDCSEVYEEGIKVKLTASPAGGSTFAGWSGACSGTGACEVTMSEAKSVSAEFKLAAKPKFLLKVKLAGTGTGAVTSSPAGIDCGLDCSEEYEEGTEVLLTGTPGANAKAVSWSGCGSIDGENKCHVTMSGAKEVTATFNLTQHQLSVSTIGTGTGKVTSSPAGIDCGSTCSAPFDHGTTVTLSQQAAAGSTFAGWSGACSGTGACEVTMSEAKEVTATFEEEAGPVLHTLTVHVSGEGEVSADSGSISGCTSAGGAPCEGQYEEGATVTLSETPAPGNLFAGWGTPQCDESTEPTCEVTIGSGDEDVAAGFEEEASEPGIPLTVALEGTGTGTVASDPGLISCSPFCEDEFPEGTKVTLTASPAPGSLFMAWRHCDTGGIDGRQCTVTMSKAKEVSAVFIKAYSLSVAKAEGSGPGKLQSSPGAITCLYSCTQASALFKEGTAVTLKATPAKHFHLAEWQGDCLGTEPTDPCELSMGEDHEVSALFAEDAKHTLTLTKTGGGQGFIKTKPTSINCGYTCTAAKGEFFANEEVAVTVTLNKGTSSVTWTTGSGTCLGNVTTCTVPMTINHTLVAAFN